MKRSLGVLLLIALVLLLGTAAAGAEGSIIGTWYGSGTAVVSGTSLPASVAAEFAYDGDFDIEIRALGMEKELEGRYRYAGDQLTLSVEGYGVYGLTFAMVGDQASMAGRIDLPGYSAELAFKLNRRIVPTPDDDPVIVVTEKAGALVWIRDDLYEAVKGAALPALSYKAPIGWENASARWHSDRPSVLSVTHNGMIAAKKAGLAEVELELRLGREDESADIDIRVVDLQLNKKKVNLYLRARGKKRSTYALVPIARPKSASAAVRNCVYVSDSPSIVTVNELGVLTAVGQGTAQITATNEYGQVAICRVVVKK